MRGETNNISDHRAGAYVFDQGSGIDVVEYASVSVWLPASTVCGSHEFDAHAAAGTRNQPNFLAHHVLEVCTCYLPNRSIRYASSGPSSPSYASCAIARVNGSRYRAICSGPASTGSKPTSRISCATTFFASSLLPQ